MPLLPCIYTSTVVKAIKTLRNSSKSSALTKYLYKYSRKGYQDLSFQISSSKTDLYLYKYSRKGYQDKCSLPIWIGLLPVSIQVQS